MSALVIIVGKGGEREDRGRREGEEGEREPDNIQGAVFIPNRIDFM